MDNVHRNLPAAVRPTHYLVKNVSGEIKGPLIQAIRHYSDQLPRSSIRHNAKDRIQYWPTEAWTNLYYFRTFGKRRSDILFVVYHPDALWIYRGPFFVVCDLFGDRQVACVDRLRLTVPIWSKLSLDKMTLRVQGTLAGAR